MWVEKEAGAREMEERSNCEGGEARLRLEGLGERRHIECGKERGIVLCILIK